MDCSSCQSCVYSWDAFLALTVWWPFEFDIQLADIIVHEIHLPIAHHPATRRWWRVSGLVNCFATPQKVTSLTVSSHPSLAVCLGMPFCYNLFTVGSVEYNLPRNKANYSQLPSTGSLSAKLQAKPGEYVGDTQAAARK